MEQNIQNWLNSDLYHKQIENLLSLIKKGCTASSSESETASIFENNLYHLIKSNANVDFSFNKETALDNIQHIFYSTKTSKGRLDAVVNKLVIEYKHHTKLKTKKHIQSAIMQVTEYLQALYNLKNEQYNAILTDGLHICYFVCQPNGEVEHSSLTDLCAKDVDLIVNSIVSNDAKKFEAKNITNDFSISVQYSTSSKQLAIALYDLLKKHSTDKTRMLYAEWMNLMHLSLNDDKGKSNDIEKRRKDLSLIFSDNINDAQGEYQALYALQTTYAIIVKLFACRVVDRIEFNKDSESFANLTNLSPDELQKVLQKIEDGYSYRSNNISNFLEGDYFSWYSDPKQWTTTLWQHIKDAIGQIELYSTYSLNIKYHPIDIFKDLYMGIIPKSIRHSMGEYFTPYWLADYVVTRGLEHIKNKHWKAIDPCCGSGIFVLALIKHIVGERKIIEMSETEKSDIIQQITSRVYGVDINPLSVLSARVGYYLALLPFGKIESLDLPIYLGDSAIIPTEITIDSIPCYKYVISTEKIPIEVVLPIEFVQSSQFVETMNDLQALVNSNEKILFEALMEKMPPKASSSIELRFKLEQLAVTLNKLYINQWDGIWVRIITNFMLIARLKNIDFIVGNPPWVKWEHLPANYANRIKQTCDIQHIFSSDGGQYGGTQLNICALIANMTAKNWLSEDGMLAFLMPDSIMSQNSYEGFRNFYIDYNKGERLYLQFLDKFEAPLRPFRYEDSFVSQDFNTYYFARKKMDYTTQHGVPVSIVSRQTKVSDEIINDLDSYTQAQHYLTFTESKAVQLSNSTAFTYLSNEFDFSLLIGKSAYQYRTGVEFTPQELYMLCNANKSTKIGFHRFTNKKFARSKYLVTSPLDGWDLPTKYIYPIVTSPNITPFHYVQNEEYAIIPYNKEDTKKPIGEKDLFTNQKELYLYLTTHKNIIDQQSEKSKQMHRGEEFYALSKIGKYTFAPSIVAARDNTYFCASVIKQTKTNWGEIKDTICVKHTIIISMTNDNRFITEDEAYYICGILNATIVNKYIHSSFKSNGISLKKSQLYLPEYDTKNRIHTQIANLSRNISINEASKSEIQIVRDKISELYIEMCRHK